MASHTWILSEHPDCEFCGPNSTNFRFDPSYVCTGCKHARKLHEDHPSEEIAVFDDSRLHIKLPASRMFVRDNWRKLYNMLYDAQKVQYKICTPEQFFDLEQDLLDQSAQPHKTLMTYLNINFTALIAEQANYLLNMFAGQTDKNAVNWVSAVTIFVVDYWNLDFSREKMNNVYHYYEKREDTNLFATIGPTINSWESYMIENFQGINTNFMQWKFESGHSVGECAVCLEDMKYKFQIEDIHRCRECKKLHHTECVKKLIRCPLCRTDYKNIKT